MHKLESAILFAMRILGTVVALMGGLALLQNLLRKKREPLTCEDCGYPVVFNESGRCPECGTVLPFHLRWRIVRGSSRAGLGPQRASGSVSEEEHEP
jgi:hypothetical protein